MSEAQPVSLLLFVLIFPRYPLKGSTEKEVLPFDMERTSKISSEQIRLARVIILFYMGYKII